MWKRLKQGCLVVIAVFVGLSILGALVGGGDDTADAPAPTSAPAPEATAVPDEPAPTDVPPPVPVDVQAYMGEVLEHMGPIQESMSAMGELMQNPRPGTDDWSLAVAVQLASIQSASESIIGIEDVPADMTETHLQLVTGMHACDRMTRQLASAIDAMDTTLMDEAGASLQQCSDGITGASDAFTEYMSQFQ